jgi:hypothetical protein
MEAKLGGVGFRCDSYQKVGRCRFSSFSFASFPLYEVLFFSMTKPSAKDLPQMQLEGSGNDWVVEGLKFLGYQPELTYKSTTRRSWPSDGSIYYYRLLTYYYTVSRLISYLIQCVFFFRSTTVVLSCSNFPLLF